MPNRSTKLKNVGKQNPNYDKEYTPSHGHGKLMAGGNPNKFYTNVQPMLPFISQWIAEGKTDDQIFNILEVSSASWYRYKEEQPELQEVYRIGKSSLVMKLEKRMYEKILTKSDTDYKHDSLHMFALKKNSPEKYSDKNDKANDIPVGTIEIVTKNVSMKDKDLDHVIQDVIDMRAEKTKG